MEHQFEPQDQSLFPLVLKDKTSKLGNMCDAYVCEGSHGSFGKLYRHLSKMENAKSISELEDLWGQAQEKGYGRRLEKDYIRILKELKDKFEPLELITE